MMKKIGVIGIGNMGGAIIAGMISSGFIAVGNIIASDKNGENLSKIKTAYPELKVTEDNKVIAENADIIIIAVKPDIYEIVINDIKEIISEDTIIVTIAAGIKLAAVERMFSFSVKVIRTMPNTPVFVGAGMTALCGGSNVSTEDIRYIEDVFSSFGLTEVIEEKYIDPFTAVSGSSPAYVYMFIEALADGGVRKGLPRKSAYKMAAQAVLGAAKMVLETGKHPGELKDMVCSPGGTTIEAVAALEAGSFRSTVIEAVSVCTDKAINIDKQ